MQLVDKKFNIDERRAIQKALGISLVNAEQERIFERCIEALLVTAQQIGEDKTTREHNRASAKAARKEPDEYLERVRKLLGDIDTYFFYLGVWDDIVLVEEQATKEEREVAKIVLRNLEGYTSNALSAYAKRPGAPVKRDIFLRLARDTAMIIYRNTNKLPTREELKSVAAAVWRIAFRKKPSPGGFEDICKDALAELHRSLGKNMVAKKRGIKPQ